MTQAMRVAPLVNSWSFKRGEGSSGWMDVGRALAGRCDPKKSVLDGQSALIESFIEVSGCTWEVVEANDRSGVWCDAFGCDHGEIATSSAWQCGFAAGRGSRGPWRRHNVGISSSQTCIYWFDLVWVLPAYSSVSLGRLDKVASVSLACAVTKLPFQGRSFSFGCSSFCGEGLRSAK